MSVNVNIIWFIDGVHPLVNLFLACVYANDVR